eukprot:5342843-Pyramimonas_sp.AAC.1
MGGMRKMWRRRRRRRRSDQSEGRQVFFGVNASQLQRPTMAQYEQTLFSKQRPLVRLADLYREARSEMRTAQGGMFAVLLPSPEPGCSARSSRWQPTPATCRWTT